MRSRELERARHVEEKLSGISRENLGEYSRRLKGAPAELMDNGLLQFVAFNFGKRGVQRELAEHLCSWLEQVGLLPRGESRLRALSGLSGADYQRCSEEATAWLQTAKRLAQAEAELKGVGD